ncbi:MAG: hypothetical protein AB7O21_01725 [Gammaproteobacteria bacterium]
MTLVPYTGGHALEAQALPMCLAHVRVVSRRAVTATEGSTTDAPHPDIPENRANDAQR